jgi:hypothetical protein
MKIRLLSIFFIFILCGCSDIITPTAHYAITHPLSTKTMVSAGTSKDEVREKWGEPNDIKESGFDDMGLKKEAWTYNAWFPKAPLDYRQFSRRKRIYFTGDYVTGFEDINEE